MRVMKNRERIHSLILVSTALIWGVAFVAQRVGMDYVGAFTFGGVRFALGAISLIPVALIFERDTGDKAKRRRTFLSGAVCGLVLFFASSFQQFGIVVTGSAGRSGFITGLYIILVPIFGVFLGRRLTALQWGGAAAALVGMYLLSVTDGFGSINFGDILLIICAVFWTLHILIIDRYANNINSVRFSITQFAVCSALSLICAFATEDVTWAGIVAGKVPILYGGLLSVGVAYTLQVVGQRGVKPEKAAIIFSLESLFSVVGGAVLLGEQMTPRGYAGCALIFAGIILSQLKPGDKSSSPV
ncbi:permease [Clostridia bacterium]|nr:permease [Clostridia bacterium]